MNCPKPTIDELEDTIINAVAIISMAAKRVGKDVISAEGKAHVATIKTFARRIEGAIRALDSKRCEDCPAGTNEDW